MRFLRFVLVAALGSTSLFATRAPASGLDVQLKDLRSTFFFVSPPMKECGVIKGPELKLYGRLVHCHPQDDVEGGGPHLYCRVQTNEDLYAFETKEACETTLRKRLPQAPAPVAAPVVAPVQTPAPGPVPAKASVPARATKGAVKAPPPRSKSP